MLYSAELNRFNWVELESFDEFQILKETPQNQIWHKEGNVFIHTCLVVQKMLEYISKKNIIDTDLRTILVYASLLHDIGKPSVLIKGEDGLYHNPKHAKASEDMINEIAPKLNIPSTLLPSIKSLVRWHMHPLYILTDPNPEKALLRLVNKLDKIDFESLILLKRCDCEGAWAEVEHHSLDTLDKVLELYYQTCSFPEGTLVQIEKIGVPENSPYPNYHPNGINNGYINSGRLFKPVTLGWRTYIGRNFSTSPVTKIIDKNQFETENSIYKITTI